MNTELPKVPIRITDRDPRVQMAAERTLLAWIRTGLALMAFGFVIARFALVLQTLGAETNVAFSASGTVIGILMVLLGSVASGGAAFHYRRYYRAIVCDGEKAFTPWLLAAWVAIAIAVIGMLLITYLVFVDISNWRMTVAPIPISSIS